jgi:putative addiction module CopG family antidote
MAVAHDVTLSEESKEFVQAKVASGEFASESDAINQGIAALREREEALEAWLREVALPAYDRLKADPSRAIPLAQVKANLAARRRKMA